MRARFILAIISTVLEEVALVAIVLWALPQIDVHIPVAGLVALMMAWLTYSVVIYRMGSRALRKDPVISLPDMIGNKGEVVSPVAPEGLVKIKGELWVAKSDGVAIQPGRQVTVVGQDRLKLVVKERDTARDSANTQ